jgi:hypothetical protein
LSGHGTTTIGSGATLNLAGSGAKTIDTQALVNNGTTNWTATGGLIFYNGASLLNNGTFSAQNAQSMSFGSGGAATFTNGGTFVQSGTAGSTTIGFSFNNLGTVDVKSGTLNVAVLTNSGVVQVEAMASVSVTGSYTQTAGSTAVANGAILAASPVSIQAGTLSGNGDVLGDVTNAGTVKVGASPGAFYLLDNYTQTSSGVLNIGIAGASPGSGYDVLAVNGLANLGGTLNVNLVDFFVPSVSQSFTIIPTISTGAFAVTNLPGGTAGTFGVVYGPDGVSIAANGFGSTATPTPIPAELQSLAIAVGYADAVRPNPNLPVPWQGSPNITFIGQGPIFDAGAIRLDNLGFAPINVQSVTVFFPNHLGGTRIFSLWGSFTVSPFQSVILTQTNNATQNFDTSETGPNPCGLPLAPNVDIPVIAVTLADGTRSFYSDTGHVLDTGGYDFACNNANESLQWRPIGTTGVSNLSATLTLAPPASSAVVGLPMPVQASLRDASGVPLANVAVNFTILSGPNAGQTGQVTTNSQGLATFSYTGSVVGTDTIQASVTNATGGSFSSNTVTVAWYVPTATATLTPTSSVTPTSTPTSSVTPSPTATSSATSTDSPTASITATATNSPTPSVTDSATVTSTPTSSPSSTVTPTDTSTPTASATDTPTVSPSASPTSTPSETQTTTATNTPPDTATETSTPTASPSSTPSSSSTATETLTPTGTATGTDTATVIPSDTTTPSATARSTDTSTTTSTPTPSSTPIPTNTPTASATFTVTVTPSLTVTPTFTSTATAALTATATLTASPTSTPTITTTPGGVIITSATLRLYADQTNSSVQVRVHRVTAPWNEQTVTYNSFGEAFDPTVVGSFTTKSSVTGWYSADVTALVQGWVNGAYPNDGLLLEQGWGSAFNRFRSSDSTGNATLLPKLVVCYNAASGSGCVTLQGPSTSANGVPDTYLWTAQPDGNFGSDVYLYTGYLNGGDKQSLLQFNVVVPPMPTSTPTLTPTASPTNTRVATKTPLPTRTPTATRTPSPTRTLTPTRGGVPRTTLLSNCTQTGAAPNSLAQGGVTAQDTATGFASVGPPDDSPDPGEASAAETLC